LQRIEDAHSDRRNSIQAIAAVPDEPDFSSITGVLKGPGHLASL
jgi:hypothetical protein